MLSLTFLTFNCMFKTESDPQFPPADPALGLVSTATDEDEAWRD